MDVKSCQNLSIHAFDSYLRVFLNVNQSGSKLTYFQTDSKKQQQVINTSNLFRW